MLMKFGEDKFYRGELLYEKNKIVDVPENMVDRWKKRGGVVVDTNADPDGEFEEADEEVVEDTKPQTVSAESNKRPQRNSGKKKS